MKRGWLKSNAGKAALAIDLSAKPKVKGPSLASAPKQDQPVKNSNSKEDSPFKPIKFSVQDHPNHQFPAKLSTEPNLGPDAETQTFALFGSNTKHTLTLVNFDLCDGTDKIPMLLDPRAFNLLRNNSFPPLPILGGHKNNGQNVVWESKDLPNGRTKVLALKDIEPGELIMVERPLQISPSEIPKMDGIETPEKAIDAIHARRTEAQQEKFSSLQKLLSPGRKELSLINLVKTYEIPVEGLGLGESKYRTLVPSVMQISHSCGPSAYYRFNAMDMFAEVRAVRPIQKGDEITVSHLSDVEVMGIQSERQRQFLERFGTHCKCRFCSLNKTQRKESDSRRLQLLELFGENVHTDDLEDPNVDEDKVFNHFQTRIELLEKESLETNIRHAIQDMVQGYHQMGREEECIKWAKKALPFILAESGPNSKYYRDMIQYSTDPRSYPGFGRNKHRREKLKTKPWGPPPPGINQTVWDTHQDIVHSTPDEERDLLGPELYQKIMDGMAPQDLMKTIMEKMGVPMLNINSL